MGVQKLGDIGTVLIVEDDPVQQDILKEYFQSRSLAECLFANDGKEAIRLLNAQSDAIRLITCDLNMPELDDIEFLDYLQSHQSTIPIIIITSAGGLIPDSAAMLAKANGLNLLGTIKKPAKPSQLTRMLAPVLW